MNWIIAILRLFGLAADPRTCGAARSGKWPTVRAAWLKDHNSCAACGGDTHLTVHHKQPFSREPSMELDATNLITLCEHPAHNCHFVFGHLCDWTSFNSEVERDCYRYQSQRLSRP